VNIFELLYVSWKRERQSIDLASLDADFYERIRPYVLHLENQYKNESDPGIAALFNKRWERVNYVLNDLLKIRLKKHFRDSLSGVSIPDPLPHEESEFRKNIDQVQSTFRNKVLNLEATEFVIPVVEDDSYGFFLFSENEDSIAVGSDLYNYGPFSEGDIVLMPRDNMRTYLLKSQGTEIQID